MGKLGLLGPGSSLHLDHLRMYLACCWAAASTPVGNELLLSYIGSPAQCSVRGVETLLLDLPPETKLEPFHPKERLAVSFVGRIESVANLPGAGTHWPDRADLGSFLPGAQGAVPCS